MGLTVQMSRRAVPRVLVGACHDEVMIHNY